MTFSPRIELATRAAEIAKEKHGGSFNKKQLIEASKEVFGGYGSDPRKPIKTMEDVSHAGNAMAFIDGHYPAGMSGCYVVGLNGGCGYECPVFKDGECDELGDFTLEDFKLSDEYDERVAECYWSPERTEP